MGVLNFAHASFYMLGAYIGYSLNSILGFWIALLVAPVVVGLMGAFFEKVCLRRVHKFGHVPELLVTYGLSYIVLELVQLVWGRLGVQFVPPPILQGSAFTLIQNSQEGLSFVLGGAASDMCSSTDTAVQIICSTYPATRAFMMSIALLMMLGLWLLLTLTRVGLVIQAALTHPETAETLGHNVPFVFLLVFGVGTGLAGLAGVIGGSTFITEPAMAATVGSVIFVVVVVGGMGSLAGAFVASLLIGIIQTFAIAIDYSTVMLLKDIGVNITPSLENNSLLKLTPSQVAPILPYVLLILILIFRPKGLLGARET